MRGSIVLIPLFIAFAGYGQKPAIERSHYVLWKTNAINPQLSPDGQFMVYTLVDGKRRANSLVALHTEKSWEKKLPDITSPVAISENNIAVFRQGDDTLCLFHLGTDRVQHVTNVVDYFFSRDGQYLYTQRSAVGEKHMELQCNDLQTGYRKTIWIGTTLTAKALGPLPGQVAIIGEQDSTRRRTLWSYRPDDDGAHEIQLGSLHDGWAIDTIAPRFNAAGDRLFFYLTADAAPANDAKPQVYIWTYRDSLFQSEMRLERENHRNALAMHYLTGQHTIRITEVAEEPIGHFDGNYLLIKNRFKSNRFWDDSLRSTIAIHDLRTGARTFLPQVLSHYDFDPVLSPDGNYALNYSPADSAYFAYEISSGICRNITRRLPTKIYDDLIDRLYPKPFGIAGWAMDEEAVLLYDQYDIWMVDLQAGRQGRNLTNGYGRKHQLIFSRMEPDAAMRDLENGASGYLTAFNRKDKTNGFWQFNWGADPVKCIMGPNVYAIGRVNTYGFEFPKGMAPIKARKADKYIVRRESATEHPNLYITENFRTFKKVTDFAPEKRFNWLTTELVNWVMADGKQSQGILYKPENFDPNKKYPVIFHYYQRKSDKLHEYLVPDISTATIDIPTYVSNGYLVFVPDIYYTWGAGNGPAALNAVESAAECLSRFNWVDSTRLGLQAHSHGGFQTNFIITHSSRFAAACETAGTSNLISSYGQLTGYGRSRQPGGEVGFQGTGFGIGKTPWTATDVYVRNSPVLHLHKVTTPLLMMHGDNDTAVPFEQSIELFTGLRRAGKKVWFLEYPGAGHFLAGEQAEDFTKRMREFFDHYLMGKSMPDWMD